MAYDEIVEGSEDELQIRPGTLLCDTSIQGILLLTCPSRLCRKTSDLRQIEMAYGGTFVTRVNGARDDGPFET